MIENISDIPKKSCGIYKILYDNNKIYIGQSINIRLRALDHNSKDRQPCDKALKKHKAVLTILQDQIAPEQLDFYETYWINYYKSYDKTIGYNLLKEGNAAGKRGVNNPNASFTEKELLEIISMLQNDLKLSYRDIANKYNVHPNTIMDINAGNTYYDKNLNYPLRKNCHKKAKKDSVLDYFQSIEELIAFKEDLLYRWDLSLEKDIPKKWNLPRRICQDINHGLKFSDYGGYQYPIRSKTNSLLLRDSVLKILYDLRQTNKSMSTIGLEHKLNRCTISKINSGAAYPIKNYDYPARQKKINE